MRETLIEELLALPLKYPGIKKVPSDIVYVQGCTTFKQFCVTLRGLIDPEYYCPFCQQERARRSKKFTAEFCGWGLLQNEFRREDTKQMWLIVPLRHIVDPDEISGYDWTAIGHLFKQCRGRRIGNMPGGGIMLRFGDPHYHAGSVEHFHVNVIEPIPGVDFRPPFAKTEESHEGNYTRLLRFVSDLKDRGGREWLFSPEGVLTTRPEV